MSNIKHNHCLFTPFYSFLLLFTTLCLYSCERELEYRGKETQPLMVVECVMQTGDTLALKLSHSRFFLDNSPIQGMTDADVQYQVNGGEWQSMGDGYYSQQVIDSIDMIYLDSAYLSYRQSMLNRYAIYKSDYVCKTGDEIKITITHKDYPDVSMEQTVVPKPTFSASWQMKNNDLHILFHLEQGDLPEDAVIQLQTDCWGKDYSVWYGDTTIREVWIRASMMSYDPILGKANNDVAQDYEIGLPINGQYSSYRFNIPVSALNDSHDLDVVLDPTCYSTNAEHWVEVDSVYAYACALSDDYYRYTASKEAYSSSADFDGFFAEKVQIHSNIQGGIGIFGSCNETLYTIDSINAKVVIKSDLY